MMYAGGLTASYVAAGVGLVLALVLVGRRADWQTHRRA
jgi:hypothetical protein